MRLSVTCMISRALCTWAQPNPLSSAPKEARNGKGTSGKKLNLNNILVNCFMKFVPKNGDQVGPERKKLRRTLEKNIFACRRVVAKGHPQRSGGNARGGGPLHCTELGSRNQHAI